MYTQCPDCEIAFKVTAEVLKQAAGKVRCGGCDHAFNALAYLSEQMPKQPVAAAANAAAALPELRSEIIETDGGLPQSISSEQSAALLKTLDDLAGSDIRIEDTGVEWRVLDYIEAAAPAADDDNADIDVDADAINVNELRFDDDTPLPEEFGLADESPYVPNSAPPAEEDDTDDVVEETPPEIALSEPAEWADILGEFQELAEEVAAPLDIEVDDVEVGDVEVDDTDEAADEIIDDVAIDSPSADQPMDMDTQFALQAEAMGIDLSGVDELEADEDFDDEPELEDAAIEDERKPEDDDIEDDSESEAEDESFDAVFEAEDDSELDNEVTQLDLIDDQDGQEELIEEPIVESHTIEDELAADNDASDASDASAHYVPPMTEEEHTVNMQIDQDLMALAFEDEDGFASTIVIPEKDTEKKAHEEKEDVSTDDVEDEIDTSDDNAGFESIIMEGESIRSALDNEKFAADSAAAAELTDETNVRDADQTEQSGGWRYGMVAGAVVLVFLLAVQLMHQSRETLATIPAFSNTIGAIYRAIGQPIQPAWDITGWRFEVTTSSTDSEPDELTVYSRLGNSSDGPLPYPLISISLADRFEESLGSRVLDPLEYLPTDLDPRKLVEPGNSFNAIITIKSASKDATSFNLKVCYRMTNGQLRCKDDSFLR